MPSRKLTLRRETLSSLASDELLVVAGGASAGPSCVGTCFEPRCYVIIHISPSVKPTCQETLCVLCPI